MPEARIIFNSSLCFKKSFFIKNIKSINNIPTMAPAQAPREKVKNNDVTKTQKHPTTLKLRGAGKNTKTQI